MVPARSPSNGLLYLPNSHKQYKAHVGSFTCICFLLFLSLPLLTTPGDAYKALLGKNGAREGDTQGLFRVSPSRVPFFLALTKRLLRRLHFLSCWNLEVLHIIFQYPNKRQISFLKPDYHVFVSFFLVDIIYNFFFFFFFLFIEKYLLLRVSLDDL